MVTQVLLDL
jgi:hypothetical protein